MRQNKITFSKLIYLSLFLAAGCNSSKLPMTAGHWGDRTSYNNDDGWNQDYFANSDGHKIGWVRHDYGGTSIEAHCEFSDLGAPNTLGEYETQEDAQLVVMRDCPENPPKE